MLIATRVVALAVTPFLVAAAVLLFCFPGRSGELFAWQIDPPLTAYLLASAYVGGIVFFVRVAVERHWQRVRHGFAAVVVFSGALLAATLLHLDRFSSNISFYAWLTLYATTPFIVALMWWLQRSRDDGSFDRVDARIPLGVRIVVLVVGAAALLTGAAMFLVPAPFLEHWGWQLTPLTAQVVGAVLSLPGVVAIGMLRDDRWSAFRILLHSQIVSLAAIALSLFLARGDLQWDRPAAAGFVVLVVVALVAYVVFAAVMERAARRSRAVSARG